MYAAIIYDKMNIITRVEVRPTEERAKIAGEFFTRRSGWYRITNNEDDIEISKELINA